MSAVDSGPAAARERQSVQEREKQCPSGLMGRKTTPHSALPRQLPIGRIEARQPPLGFGLLYNSSRTTTSTFSSAAR